MKKILTIIFLLSANYVFGQDTLPGDEEWFRVTMRIACNGRPTAMSEDSLFRYVKLFNSHILKIDKHSDSITLFSEDTILLMIGHVKPGCPNRETKGWVGYYLNGKTRIEGSYGEWGMGREGLWKTYYENGQVKAIINYIYIFFGNYPKSYGVEKSVPIGNYYEYYPNGIVKVKGQYGLTSGVDTIQMTQPDPPYENYDVAVKGKTTKKKGAWRYYNEQGVLVKREKY